jgi:hypothetical protein
MVKLLAWAKIKRTQELLPTANGTDAATVHDEPATFVLFVFGEL